MPQGRCSVISSSSLKMRMRTSLEAASNLPRIVEKKKKTRERARLKNTLHIFQLVVSRRGVKWKNAETAVAGFTARKRTKDTRNCASTDTCHRTESSCTLGRMTKLRNCPETFVSKKWERNGASRQRRTESTRATRKEGTEEDKNKGPWNEFARRRKVLPMPAA